MSFTRYPIINGKVPPMEPVNEYHILTPRGAIACTFDDPNLALKRFGSYESGFRLVRVERRITDITPITPIASSTELRIVDSIADSAAA
jgi:hypothetical protein